jgi:GT2 family glycosyltransferase
VDSHQTPQRVETSEDASQSVSPRLFCIIVTYRRAEAFQKALNFALTQHRSPDGIVVVDNEESDLIVDLVDRGQQQGTPIQLIQPGDNLGPAGGTAIAMERILLEADDGDWITRIDDDNELEDPDIFGRLFEFALDQHRIDPLVAAVGGVGSRYDWKRGRLVRIDDSEIDAGPVDVDYVPTNLYPAFRVGAVRDVGVFDRKLFYGSSEVEYGLRLRRAGYRLLADPVLWRRLGRRWEHTAGARRTLRPFSWRRYYSLRNQIHILIEYGHPWTAVKVGTVRGLLKPLANVPFSPRLALTHLKWSSRAVFDGWRGRMGRTYDPEDFPG